MNTSARITVKLSPRAARNAIRGWADGPDGTRWLKCAVTAVPEKGRANAALIELLAAHTGMSRSVFSIARGQADTIKIVEIQGFNGAVEKLFGPPVH